MIDDYGASYRRFAMLRTLKWHVFLNGIGFFRKLFPKFNFFVHNLKIFSCFHNLTALNRFKILILQKKVTLAPEGFVETTSAIKDPEKAPKQFAEDGINTRQYNFINFQRNVYFQSHIVKAFPLS